ncbi:MAG: condensation domain-containing protein [Bacteroidota bacterium]|nr:condensation domain-containing protein [Bacteroidota bacterium]
MIRTSGGEDDRLLIVVHHLGIDGISWRILMEDLHTAYNQLLRNGNTQLPKKTTSYKEWSDSLKEFAVSDKITEQKDYWLSLADKKIQSLPYDNSAGSNTAESIVTVTVESNEQDTQTLLREVPKAYNTQINDILLTALINSYHKWSTNDRLLINLEGHGREGVNESIDVSRTIGWFTSVYPVLLETENPDDIAESIKLVKEYLRQIPDNGIGFGLLKYLNTDADIKERFRSFPVPELVFNYLGQLNLNITPESDWKLGKRLIVSDQNEKGNHYHKLEINSIISDGKLRIDFTFSRNNFHKETIENFSRIYMDVLKNIIEHCAASENGGYTPSDFSASGLDQHELDNLLANLN